jgi:NitT/TauT family transport system ATP-binding protein
MALSIPSAQPAGDVLLEVRAVSHYYGEPERGIRVLENVNLEIRAGELIALLGPSGSGKSTLLRILAGLLAPSRGQVLVHGSPLRGPNPEVAMVFQSFALFPWLTVLQNVELGLLPTDMPPAERRERALGAIDLIGLDGFEGAYPREISGGMKQRVGFARALVVEPEVLLLDEPFSALDVLVADNLRHELLDLWLQRKIPTQAILMVTHNIDEAVHLADRLIVFGADPGCIRVECAGIPREARREKSPTHPQLVDSIYQVMMRPREDAAGLLSETRSVAPVPATRPFQFPAVTIGQLTGFLQRLQALGGREGLHDLGRDLPMSADELLPLAEAADLLDFVDLIQGDIVLTPEGRRFVEAGVLERKELFHRQALAHVGLLRQIVQDLKAAPDHRLKETGLLDTLEQSFSPGEARRRRDTAVDWGRYAEAFAYDDAAGEFSLEDEKSGVP